MGRERNNDEIPPNYKKTLETLASRQIAACHQLEMINLMKAAESTVQKEFYGKITLSFERGKVTLINKSQNIKPGVK